MKYRDFCLPSVSDQAWRDLVFATGDTWAGFFVRGSIEELAEAGYCTAEGRLTPKGFITSSYAHGVAL